MVSCGGSSSSKQLSKSSTLFDINALPVTAGVWYQPIVDTSWQIQLLVDNTYPLISTYSVDLYDVDLFDTDISTITTLKNSGKKVICYFSAGSYENWRDDANDFSSEVLGSNLDGWPGEKWLDISNENLAPIMRARLDLAVTKGCDGVDPDNMDGYTQNSGFTITADQQLAYNKFIANEARTRGLSVGLKNDLAQVQSLVDYYDFAVNEQCNTYDECSLLTPFIDAGKPVFNIEYDDSYVNNTNGERDTLCYNTIALQFKTLILPNNLDGSFRYSCE
jgi:hypothetical protein